MARTRGGGVISGIPGQSRRNGGKSRTRTDLARGYGQNHVQQPHHQQHCPTLPSRSTLNVANATNGTESVKEPEPETTPIGRRASGRRVASPSTAELRSDGLLFPGAGGMKKIKPPAQEGVVGLGSGESVATLTSMLAMTNEVRRGGHVGGGSDDEDDDDTFEKLFNDDSGGEKDGSFAVAPAGGGGGRENVLPAASLEFPPHQTRTNHQTGREQFRHLQRAAAHACQVRKSPLLPPKPAVWRMLYVDPDVADPRLVARRLEVATSMALQCMCVFDVATDIVQALADVREDTMSLYRGVFINESLRRHQMLAQSIEGKHLARFFRQAGMSGARIVLLVGGDVQFDTADAGAHGLSAVLRKPFTRDGFCDVLRGMYFGNDNDQPLSIAANAGGAGEQSRPFLEARPCHPQPSQSSAATPSPCATCGAHTPSPSSHPYTYNSHIPYPRTRIPPAADVRLTSAIDRRLTGFFTVGARGAAATATAAIHHQNHASELGRPAFPACLGFTPFPSVMMEQLRRYHVVPGFGRPPVLGSPVGQRSRRYAKIAPREAEDDEKIPGGAPSPEDESSAEKVGAPISGDSATTNVADAASSGRCGEEGEMSGGETRGEGDGELEDDPVQGATAVESARVARVILAERPVEEAMGERGMDRAPAAEERGLAEINNDTMNVKHQQHSRFPPRARKH